MIRIVVNGAAGRMGRRILAVTVEDMDVEVVGAFEVAGHPLLGEDAGGQSGGEDILVPLTTRRPVEADVVIDFSHAGSALEIIDWCVEHGIALVTGTTGTGEAGDARLATASETIAVLAAPNMSVGVNVLAGIVGSVARALGDGYDVEIIEAHHNKKKDAPSGTALRLGERVAEGLRRDLADVAVHGREGMAGERTADEIGFHAVRAGDIVGEHTVLFGGLGERVEIRHVATSRDIFARGAIRAAKFLAVKPPGQYFMADVLGLG